MGSRSRTSTAAPTGQRRRGAARRGAARRIKETPLERKPSIFADPIRGALGGVGVEQVARHRYEAHPDLRGRKDRRLSPSPHGRARPRANLTFLPAGSMRTFSPISSDSPACSATASNGAGPANDTRSASSNTAPARHQAPGSFAPGAFSSQRRSRSQHPRSTLHERLFQFGTTSRTGDSSTDRGVGSRSRR
jgi:hypothetical protein